jgi:hypothetical protein
MWGLLRALATTAVLLALYYVSPLDHVEAVPLPVSLIALLLVLVGVTIWQVRAITRAAYPGVRAMEALAATVPLFLLLFAATYFLMAQDDPANFSAEPLTRTDTLYMTITIFSTVGFGDISAASQSARLVASLQMVLDLLVLGLGIRVFTSAVERGREKKAPDRSTATDEVLGDGGNAT